MPVPLYLCAVAIFAMGTSEFMLAGLIPDIGTTLNVSTGAAGLLTSAFAVGMVVGAPLMAALTRRWPARASLLAFLLIFTLAHVVGALATSFALLLITRVVAAVANAGFLAVALGMVSWLVPPDRKGRALAVLLSGITLATVAGAPGGALLGALLGFRATFWAIVLLCVPALFGILKGIPTHRGTAADSQPAVGSLRVEVAELARPRLLLVMLLASLVNAATFATFTFLAPIVTDQANLGEFWVPLVLMVFGSGAFLGVTMAGRWSDQRPGVIIGLFGPMLLFGWIALAVLAANPTALLVLSFAQGALSFAVGSTLITRVLHEGSNAPTMAGAYATASLNMGAAAGPVMAAWSLGTASAEMGPVWVSSALIALSLVIVLPALRIVAPRNGQRPGT